MTFKSNDDLELELRTSELAGPVVPSSRWRSFVTAGPHIIAFVPLVTAALGVFATVAWPFVDVPWLVLLRTVFWLVFAVVIVGGLGFLLASRTRLLAHWPATLVMLLAAPFGASVLVSGIAWRLIVDSVHGTGGFGPALSPFQWHAFGIDFGLWIVLLAAFTWTWLGFTISLFRAGLDAVEHDPVAKDKFGSSSFWGKLFSPKLRPITLVVALTLAVAGARVFDLILIVAPSSLYSGVETISVRWWRLDNELGSPAAADRLATWHLLMLAIIGIFIYRKFRPHEGGWQGPPPRASRFTTEDLPRRPWMSRGLIRFGMVLFALPFLVLIFTALKSPAAAVSGAWLSGFGLGSFVRALEVGLLASMATTFVVATLTTLATVSAGLLVAYLLASRWFYRWAQGIIVFAIVVLAVTPVQAYVAPIREFTSNTLGLAGSAYPLMFVHVAAGLPFAVLVLRGALVAAPRTEAADTLFGLAGSITTIGRIGERIGGALIAVAVLQWVQVWNDFVVGLLMVGPGSSPVTLLLWGEARLFSSAAGPIAAGAVVASIPPLVLLLLTWRRWVVPGLTRGLLR